jgi:hypothetical protein
MRKEDSGKLGREGAHFLITSGEPKTTTSEVILGNIYKHVVKLGVGEVYNTVISKFFRRCLYGKDFHL